MGQFLNLYTLIAFLLGVFLSASVKGLLSKAKGTATGSAG